MSEKSKQIVVLCVLCLILLSVLFFTIFSTGKTTQSSKQAKEDSLQLGYAGAVFTEGYTTLTGESVSIQAVNDDIIVAQSWATWSPGAGSNLQVLEQIAKEFEEEGVTVLAVNRGEQAPVINSYMQSVGELQHVQVVLDESDNFYTTIEGYTMPETVIFDSEGDVLARHKGAISYETLRTLVLQAQ